MKDLPEPVKTDVRICFGIHWFTSEEDAKAWGDYSRNVAGNYYNGGYFHGMPCGRDKGHDYVDKELGQLYAATF